MILFIILLDTKHYISYETIVSSYENHFVKELRHLKFYRRYQLSTEEIQEETVQKEQGKITKSGTLAVNTDEFTGRFPKDRFIVKRSNYCRENLVE